jgi:two-component system, NtrC family, sensor histidine kinase HydH
MPRARQAKGSQSYTLPMKKILVVQWVDGAVIAVAIVAALALGATVLVARKEFNNASIAMVRGEGEALATRLHARGMRAEGGPSEAVLQAQLEEFRSMGLRFVALPNRGIAAGYSYIHDTGFAPGTLVVRDSRALLVSAVPAHPRRSPPPDRIPQYPPRLVIEFEPQISLRAHAGMNYTLVVAAVSVAVLLALAGVLSVRAMRQSLVDRKAVQEKRLALLGQMAGVMAHELRNPLASLKGHAQLLEETLLVGSQERVRAAVVVAEAVRLERLTRDLLAFVRDGTQVLHTITPAVLLERVLRDFAPGRIEVDLQGAPAELCVDEARIAVAIGNLVQNAIQATAVELPVGVRVALSGTEVIIDVSDQGPGVAPGEEERIFEPFYTTRIHGTGLGLAVARRAVEEQGGTLRFEPTPTGGSVFRIRLPAHRAQAPGSGV